MIDLDQIGADIQYVRKHTDGDIEFTVLLKNAIDGLIRKACDVIEEEIESIIDQKVLDSGSIIVRQIDTFGIGWEAPKKLSRLKEIELQEIYVSKEEEGVIYFLTKDEDIVYVGQSGMATCGDRINRHIKDGKEFNRSFYFTVKKEKLNFTEQFFIKKFQPKYNTSHNIQNMAV
jgi:hypothetical protein